MGGLIDRRRGVGDPFLPLGGGVRTGRWTTCVGTTPGPVCGSEQRPVTGPSMRVGSGIRVSPTTCPRGTGPDGPTYPGGPLYFPGQSRRVLIRSSTGGSCVGNHRKVVITTRRILRVFVLSESKEETFYPYYCHGRKDPTIF